MSKDWRERLQEVIRHDGRSLRAISAATEGVGENYLQQVLKDEKDPGFSRLARVLSQLGPEATVYVTSGEAIDPEQHLRLALIGYGITDETDLTTAINVVRRLSGRTNVDTREQDHHHGQSQPSNRRRAKAPSR